MKDINTEISAKSAYKLWGGIKKACCVLITFLYVNVAWIFFRANSISDALRLIKHIFIGGFGKPIDGIVEAFNLDEFWYILKILHLTNFTYSRDILMILFTIVILLVVFFGKNVQELAKKWKPNILTAIITVFLFVWCIVSLSGVSTFLYFNF